MDLGEARELLGVSRNASSGEISLAFKHLMFQHHPDRNQNDPDAHERTCSITRARDVLTAFTGSASPSWVDNVIDFMARAHQREVDEARDAFLRHRSRFGLPRDAIGQRFRRSGDWWSVLGLDPRARRYQIYCRTEAGKYLWLSASEVLAHLQSPLDENEARRHHFRANAVRVGLEQEDLGRTFMLDGTSWIVVDVDPSSRKGWILCRNKADRSRWFSALVVLACLSVPRGGEGRQAVRRAEEREWRLDFIARPERRPGFDEAHLGRWFIDKGQEYQLLGLDRHARRHTLATRRADGKRWSFTPAGLQGCQVKPEGRLNQVVATGSPPTTWSALRAYFSDVSEAELSELSGADLAELEALAPQTSTT